MSRRASRKKTTRRGGAPPPARRPAGAPAVRTSSAWKLVPAGIGALLIGGLVALLALSSSTESSREAGRVAPAFAMRTIDGERVSLANQRGKVTVLEFLEPGCPSCTVDVAGLSEIAQEDEGDVTILIADVGGLGADSLQGYYRGELGAPPELLIAADSGFKVAQKYNVQELGETVVIDPEGRVSWRGVWDGDSDRIVEQIEEAV